MEKITPNIVNDEQLKQYFLGQIAPETAENLEEQIAADDSLFEQAQMVEAELLDDYLRGNLSIIERKLFAENYLTNAARRANLHSAENLWHVSGGEVLNEDVPKTFAPRTFWQNLSGHWQRPLMIGTAAAILFFGIIAGWIFTKKEPEIVRQPNIPEFPAPVSQNNLPNAPSFNNLPLVNSSINSRKPEHSPLNIVAPKKSVPPSASKDAPPIKKQEVFGASSQSFSLASGNLRDQGEQFIKLSRSAKNISLHLELPKDAAKYQSYRATLKNADGETLSVLPNLKSLKISLRAAKLENRTYMIFLEGENAPKDPEPITEFVFCVRR